jgi:hypothetical protein
MKKFFTNKFSGVWFEALSFLAVILFFLYLAVKLLVEYWRL